MQRIDETGRETAAVHCAAVKAGIDLVTLDALPGQIVADLEIGDQHGVSRFQDGERVADMIVVAMRKQHMRDALGGLLPPPFSRKGYRTETGRSGSWRRPPQCE